MALPDPQNRPTAHPGLNALRATASTFGVYAGLLGIEHGFFETLQGTTPIRTLKILAVGPSELPFPFGHEPAMTLLPNFLLTGLLAMTAGLAVALWSATCLRRKHAAAILLLLSAVLFVVGGGFGPITLLIAACIGASGIGRPLTGWRRRLPPGVLRALAALWPWVFAGALAWVPAEFLAGQILHLQNDHRQILANLNLLLTYPMLALFALSILTGFARQAQVPVVQREG
jgi:hypothetical protein